MRVFLAFDLPGSVREIFGQFLSSLQEGYNKHHISWSGIENLHITLEFFDNRNEEEISRIEEVVTQYIQRIEKKKLEVRFGKYAAFPHHKKPRVLLIQVYNQGVYNVTDFQHNLHNLFVNKGIDVQSRIWKPHVTLGWINDKGAKLNVEQFTFMPFTATMAEITLYKSELQPKGAVYTALHTWRISDL